MTMTALLFVSHAAIPAVMLLVAVRAAMSWREHPAESLAWIIMSGALTVTLGFPALLEVWRTYTGVAIPVQVAGLAGVGAGCIAVAKMHDRVSARDHGEDKVDSKASR